MRVLRIVSALLASIGLLATGVTAAHADDPPLPIPGSPVCELVSTTLADHYLDFIGFLIPQIIQNNNDTVVVQKTTASFSASASATVSASVGLNSDEVKAETGITVQASVTVSASQETDVTVNPHATVYAQYGAFMLTLVYHRTYSPPGCNEPFSFLPGWETTDYKSAPTGLGWRVWAFGTTALETPLRSEERRVG